VLRTVRQCSYVHTWVKINVLGSYKISYFSTNRHCFTPREAAISIFILLYREHAGTKVVGNVGKCHINGAIPSNIVLELSYTLCYVSTTYHRNVVVGRVSQLLRIPKVSGLYLDPEIRYTE
jgi:hypothetical protein